jgi:chaperonin GroES
MVYIPTGSAILVKRSEAQATTAGGLHLPEAAQDVPQEGTVIATGSMSPFNVGDVVIFGRYSGTELTLDGKKLLLLRGDEILLKKLSDEVPF